MARSLSYYFAAGKPEPPPFSFKLSNDGKRAFPLPFFFHKEVAMRGTFPFVATEEADSAFWSSPHRPLRSLSSSFEADFCWERPEDLRLQ